jgi:hypothetical protein
VDRLFPGMHINNGQSPHAQAHSIPKVKSVIVRASPPNERTHSPDQWLINVSGLCVNRSDNATHIRCIPLRSSYPATVHT